MIGCLIPLVPCDYEHFGEDLPSHSILTCPILHRYCDLCMCVGHHHNVHHSPAHLRPHRELRQLYFRNMHRGAWTSLPFLSLDPETAKVIKARHWFYSYDGEKFRHSNITRYALKIDKPLYLGNPMPQEIERRYTIWKKDEDVRIEEYKKRIYARSPLDIEPLSRRFLREKLTAEAKLAKEQRRIKHEALIKKTQSRKHKGQ